MDLMGLMQVESLGGKRYVFYSTKSPTEVISIPTADLLVISLENNSGDITSTSLSGSKPLVPSIHIEGVNFSETFAHVARLEAIQLILRFACIHQGFVDMINPKHAYKLSKNLNGLKQAPNAWYEYLLKFLSQQEKYARNIVKKFGLEKAKFKCTSATFDFKVSQDDSRNKVDESLYRSIIGSLLYLTASRLNIAFAMGIGLVARKIERVLLFDATRRYPYKAFGDFCFESLRARLGVCSHSGPANDCSASSAKLLCRTQRQNPTSSVLPHVAPSTNALSQDVPNDNGSTDNDIDSSILVNIIPDLNAPPIDPSIFKFPGSVLETSSSQPPPASFALVASPYVSLDVLAMNSSSIGHSYTLIGSHAQSASSYFAPAFTTPQLVLRSSIHSKDSASSSY
ncbi:putative mitochondrial protein [Cucumis melo var. makuwa]|uniref:Putative mitochondrial protein n=1 Tax=Cucumis melo var. makuwa TaxID=1194695 RepID=A0A5D3BRA6_CUCMM|nr:putative mitochondrial protein [Cucumis melo var. makuwa]